MCSLFNNQYIVLRHHYKADDTVQLSWFRIKDCKHLTDNSVFVTSLVTLVSVSKVFCYCYSSQTASVDKFYKLLIRFLLLFDTYFFKMYLFVFWLVDVLKKIV